LQFNFSIKIYFLVSERNKRKRPSNLSGKKRRSVLTLILATKMVDLDVNEFYLVKEVSLRFFHLKNILKTYLRSGRFVISS
jgi:hypothetical protein